MTPTDDPVRCPRCGCAALSTTAVEHHVEGDRLVDYCGQCATTSQRWQPAEAEVAP